MNDDYLWDKSGEPDEDVEQLEQLLGNLRYRRPSAPLPLPQRAPVRPQRRFKPFLAAAAALLVMMFAAGLWLTLGPGRQAEKTGIAGINVQTGRAQDWLNADSLFVMTPPTKDELAKQFEKQAEPQFVVTNSSRSNKPRRSIEPNRRALPEERIAKSSSSNRLERISEDEGVAAREQLIQALHLAGSKLQRVQKKVQDNKSFGPVT
jgi:hypothetical protein